MTGHAAGQQHLRLGILVGRSAHPQAVIDDLWNRAAAAVARAGWQLTGTAAYVHDGGKMVEPSGLGLSVAAIRMPDRQLVPVLAGRPGPAGAAARLLQDNQASRRLARALAGRGDLLQAFCASAVVVAAGTEADRAVWELRNRTGAELVHGPIAMLHALRRILRD